LILKIHNAINSKKNSITIWGTGKPRRELLFVDDLADACIYFLNKKTEETLINIGGGQEMKIIDFAKFIIKELGVKLSIKLDLSKPDGTPRKILDNKIARKYGWRPKTDFKDGFKITYLDFLRKFKNR
jgi:GDP-L-fucose synthase